MKSRLPLSPIVLSLLLTGSLISASFEANAQSISEMIDGTGDGAGNTLSQPQSVGVDAAGNIYVAGSASHNAFKITPGGSITEIIDASGDGFFNTLSSAYWLVVDDPGNVYVTGAGSNNAFKVTPGGSITEIIDSGGDDSGNSLNAPYGIAIDGSGNAYVTGLFSNNAFKITPGGTITEIIDATGDDGGNTLSMPGGVAVDGSGNVYVAGLGSHNVFKITPGGSISEIIDSTGDGSGNTLNEARRVAADGSGNVFVTGGVTDNVFKITPGGTITKILDATGDGAGNTLDRPSGICVDASGNVYVGGRSHNAFKVTPGGSITEIVDATGDGGSNTLDRANGVAVDAAGNAYVAAFGSSNAFKVPAALLPVELASLTVVPDGSDAVLSWLTLSESDNAGFEVQHRTDEPLSDWRNEGFVQGHGSTVNEQLYTFRIDGLAPGKHLFRLKQMDLDGTFSYSAEVAAHMSVIGSYRLHAAYPNPFNPSTSISFDLPEAGDVRLRVFDVLGREVARLADAPMQKGRHTIGWDATDVPGGLYLYRLVVRDFSQTRQVVLLK